MSTSAKLITDHFPKQVRDEKPAIELDTILQLLMAEAFNLSMTFRYGRNRADRKGERLVRRTSAPFPSEVLRAVYRPHHALRLQLSYLSKDQALAVADT